MGKATQQARPGRTTTDSGGNASGRATQRAQASGQTTQEPAQPKHGSGQTTQDREGATAATATRAGEPLSARKRVGKPLRSKRNPNTGVGKPLRTARAPPQAAAAGDPRDLTAPRPPAKKERRQPGQSPGPQGTRREQTEDTAAGQPGSPWARVAQQGRKPRLPDAKPGQARTQARHSVRPVARPSAQSPEEELDTSLDAESESRPQAVGFGASNEVAPHFAMPFSE